VLKSYFRKGAIEAGCDEAGRGCLAGPVTAAAVILPEDYFHPELNDSKQLSWKTREALRAEIEKEAVSFQVQHIDPKTIDEINILNASFLAMHQCIANTSPTPDLLLIDGNRFNKYKNISHQCIIKGDAKYFSIAAASILAKTYRDEYMTDLDLKFPEYHWKTNKGYPTRQHRDAIKKLGATEHHRLSFQLLPAQLELFE